MTSPALRHKILKMQMNAPMELPKARICTAVILSAVEQNEQELQDALTQLKSSVGNNWSLVHALLFMSGRQAGFCVDAAGREERASIHLAHLVAKSACDAANLGGAPHVYGMDISKFKAIVDAS